MAGNDDRERIPSTRLANSDRSCAQLFSHITIRSRFTVWDQAELLLYVAKEPTGTVDCEIKLTPLPRRILRELFLNDSSRFDNPGWFEIDAVTE
jgi:hypothetical protein